MDFYSQIFNPNYMNQSQYQQIQAQIMQYQQNQSQEVYNFVKAVHDMCKAMKKLDPEHQQQAFALCLAEFAREFGWGNQ